MERVLDFGCGCGRITRHWQSINGVDIFADKDVQLIAWARNNLTFGRFTTHQLKSKLNYPDNYFDFVYSIAVFGHFREEHQKHWMKEIRRVLKTGGYFLVTVKGSNRIGELNKGEATQFNAGELVVIEPDYSGDHYCLAYDPYSYFSRHLATGMMICYFESSGSPDTRQDVYLLQKI